MMKKVCEVCSKEFEALRSTGKFCSIKCRNKYNEDQRYPRIRIRKRVYISRPKINLKCKFCGKEFLGWSNRLYCSRLCRERKRDRSNYNRQRQYEISSNFRKKTTARTRAVEIHHETM
jgi:hypothetical protein